MPFTSRTLRKAQPDETLLTVSDHGVSSFTGNILTALPPVPSNGSSSRLEDETLMEDSHIKANEVAARKAYTWAQCDRCSKWRQVSRELAESLGNDSSW